MITMIGRLTLFYLLYPALYLSEPLKGFDLEYWIKNEYTWKQDPFGGYLDHVQPVHETIRSGTGDCVDFSAVILSATDVPGRILVYNNVDRPLAGHVVVEVDGTIYDSSMGIVPEGRAYYEEQNPHRELLFTRECISLREQLMGKLKR